MFADTGADRANLLSKREQGSMNVLKHQFVAWLIDRWFIKKPHLRRFVSNLIEGDSDRKVEIIGTTLWINSIKEHGYLRTSRLAARSSFLRYECPPLFAVVALLMDGDTFVDVGANVGIWSLTVARLTPILPRIRVWAFEANPDTFQRLERSFRFHDNVVATNIAISNTEGELDFVSGAVSNVFTTRANRSEYTLADSAIQRIACARLDSFPITGEVILKIDVEGQELEVLQGAKRFFDEQKIRVVYIDGYKDRAVETLLGSFGFELLEGRSLKPAEGHVFSLLAVHRAYSS